VSSVRKSIMAGLVAREAECVALKKVAARESLA
jgi:hypothetical protein